jgi:hypothetical protein
VKEKRVRNRKKDVPGIGWTSAKGEKAISSKRGIGAKLH